MRKARGNEEFKQDYLTGGIQQGYMSESQKLVRVVIFETKMKREEGGKIIMVKGNTKVCMKNCKREWENS